ncbi:MAG: carbamoyl-phosphate synthase large subunit [Geminicoccaceae bacterium]
MPKRRDIQSILVIGAGPIVIGQACEFDYSGTQACKALREEGYRVILVNSNPATIMTDPDMADATYIEPITPEIVEKIIAREKPDACLPTMGGQTALNTARALAEAGVFARYGVELIGASREAIDKAEDRGLFRDAMRAIGLELPKSEIVHSLNQAQGALEIIGLPAIIRPAFTLGGTGGGIAYNREEYERIIATGLDASPISEVLVEESVLGWKEFEMEVVRDHADNCIIVCAIENVDPMGVHTGDSITVAPALTLTDKEYQRMRDASIAVLREIGVDTGGSNVQFAINPADGRMVVIEMNPRVSRSSALASKATGFPIAKVAAKLAVGYTLDEIDNDITGGVTPASFEPTIDYVVTKIPRFTFEKFPETEPLLTTSMKSVGEAMAMGRTFAESLQKALRSLETGLSGLDDIDIPGLDDQTRPGKAVLAALARPTPDRIRQIAQSFRLGFTVDEVQGACKVDPWFLERIREIVEVERYVIRHGLPAETESLRELKSMGFSDARLSDLTGMPEADIRSLRHHLGVRPVYKRVDTCAGEFASSTPYMYGAYETALDGGQCEAEPSERRKVIILGGGPNRIGQGIEFDYCCVHACFGLAKAGYETIMINCNPETVSTDYDTSDRLYFEPLTAEDVLEICALEQKRGTLAGVIVQLGGQTPLKLAKPLEAAGIPIFGTSPDAIDLAEDRERFQQLLYKLDLKQPANAIASDEHDAFTKGVEIGFPLVIRPSYVLGGRAMRIVYTPEELREFAIEAARASETGPVLLDRFLQDAIEIDVDVVADGRSVQIAGIMEHIEEAGIHSGDSACSLPPFSLDADLVAEIRRQAEALAVALDVRGLMNVQMAIKDRDVFILEVNPRASRTVPFVAKAIGRPVAQIAARVMAGETLAELPSVERHIDHVAVKEAVFPFARFPGVDTLLGPEMKSTGEVMGIDSDFPLAFGKSQLASGTGLPRSGRVFVSVRDSDKPAAIDITRALLDNGFTVVATRGTAAALHAAGLEQVSVVNKVYEGRPNIVDLIKDGEIALLINTTEGQQAIKDSFSMRQAALMMRLPYYTTLAGARSAVLSIAALKAGALAVTPLQAYTAGPN